MKTKLMLTLLFLLVTLNANADSRIIDTDLPGIVHLQSGEVDMYVSARHIITVEVFISGVGPVVKLTTTENLTGEKYTNNKNLLLHFPDRESAEHAAKKILGIISKLGKAD